MVAIGASFRRMNVSLDESNAVVFSRSAGALALFAFPSSLFGAAALVAIARGGARADLGAAAADGRRALHVYDSGGLALFDGIVDVRLR